MMKKTCFLNCLKSHEVKSRIHLVCFSEEIALVVSQDTGQLQNYHDTLFFIPKEKNIDKIILSS